MQIAKNFMEWKIQRNIPGIITIRFDKDSVQRVMQVIIDKKPVFFSLRYFFLSLVLWIE